MEKCTNGKMFQKLISMLLIVVMLASYFPMFVLANNEGTEASSNYITLDVNWKNVTGNILEGKAENSYEFEYYLKFNSVPTGFQNVKMTIKDDGKEPLSEITAYDVSDSLGITNNGTYSVINFKNQNTGVELRGSGSVFFAKNDELYNKDITIVFESTYKDPNTGEVRTEYIEKTLKSTITPQKEVTGYTGAINWQKITENSFEKPWIGGTQLPIGYNEYGQSLGWYNNEITAYYPIHIDAYTYTQSLELNVTINRITEEQSRMEQGYSINWNGLDTLLGEPTKKDNADGSVTYTFIKGTDSDTLIKENTFSINKDFNIAVTYTIPNTNPEQNGTINEKNTNCLFTAELKTTGFKVEKEFEQEEVIEKVTRKSSKSANDYKSLVVYTPGTHAWVSVNFNTYNNTYLQKQAIRDLINGRSLDLSFVSRIKDIDGERSETNGEISFYAPILTYLSDEGKTVTKTLTGNEMRLKSVTENASEGSNSAIIFDNNNLDFDSVYSMEENVNINNFSIEMENYLYNKFNSYITVYTLNADELGLSETELQNILSISVGMSTSGQWCQGGGRGTYLVADILGVNYSYMEATSVNDLSTNIDTYNTSENKTIKISMYKNSNIIKTEESEVVNENPVFYISLPGPFKYNNFNITSSSNDIVIDESKLDLIIAEDGNKYLVVPCIGTYNSKYKEQIDINVSFNRTLTNKNSVGNYTMDVYMFTDNEMYYRESLNSLKFKKGEETPEKTTEVNLGFAITNTAKLEAITSVVVGNNTYTPNPANDNKEKGEIELPIIVDSNSTIKIYSGIKNSGETLKNISILSRLPIANNTNIYDSNNILEDDYVIDQDFYNDKKDFLNGITKDSPVPHISLTNLNNIKVYYGRTGSNQKIQIPQSNYTLYYTLSENVNMETDLSEYEVYDQGDDLSQAKNIKVVFADGYELKSGYEITLEYEMTMPNEVGMVGAVSAVQYNKSDDTQSTLYSPAAYMINGTTNSNIVVNKKFEGYSLGKAPEGVSLSGIEFKLQYYNDANTKVFLQDKDGNDIVATTNELGVATFSNIPTREYYLYEVTQFDNYSGITNIEIIDLGPAETATYIAENKIKRGNITIKKEWEDTNIQQAKVNFTLVRTNATGENLPYSVDVTTDENGIAVAKNVPYGTYTIMETNVKDGWYAVESSKTVTLNSENVETTFENGIGKGILQIVKTVPEGETVDGLKFHITGLGKINYINKNGENVTNNTDLTITIGEDYSSNSNITIVKSENDTKATITISNMFLGLYKIEEIEIPVIEGTEIEKYVTAIAQVELTTHDTTNPVMVNIKNNYKYGYIQINKTAKLKEGDSYTEIGDLSSFLVRITGNSYYGKQIDKTIRLDENGYGIAKVEIGTYTITEIPQDGYTTYYGKDATASTTPPEVTINYNQTYKQDLYNEHSGVGYVRVEKTLEGKTDPQEVLNAGIEFKVVGQNVAGGRVNETIKIDKIDTAKNVAYGISGPISSGGEYVLQEVENTIPEYYEGIEEITLDLKVSHTQDAPLVINAVNNRTKGNLEIITTTYPTGGPLTGITYKVTEVEINKDGSYVKVGETLDVEGSNDLSNPSYAKLENIYAGYYLVEQITVPVGWEKDLPQIVEVPSYNTGYATFEITQVGKLKNNKVTINKVVLNSNNEIVTDEELENAQLNLDESFEVKLTNIETNKQYFVFTSVEEPGVIQGLDAGTYMIEEVYKPKYLTEGYYNHVKVEPNSIEGLLQTVNVSYVEEKINETEGKYIFTIKENGDIPEDVTLTVKNKINTNFGFGGQDSADNLSKVDYKEEEIQIVTKTVIYVVDENNNAISGAKFKLVNEKGQLAVFENKTEFEINNRKVIIRGLEPGKYTLVCTQYPEGYLKPDDKEIIVFSDAVQVARVEIQKNIPRGAMLLSTVYTTEDNETEYVSRSKYKVVDKDTGELVKFVRTATGDYRKSNLPDASPVIVLKSGTVEVEGIEVGEYEVGIVDVTKGYGIQSELPEMVSIEQNEVENVSVEVINKEIVQIGAGSNTTWYLNESGELFVLGTGYSGIYGNGLETNSNSQFTKIQFVDNVKIAKFSVGNNYAMAIDTEGKVWSWGGMTNGVLGTGDSSTSYVPVCITELGNLKNEYYNENTRFVDVQINANNTSILLDNKGRIWTCGYNTGNGTSSTIYEPVCISEIEGTELNDSYNSGVKIAKIGTSIGSGYKASVIDNLGRVWAWGTQDYVLGTGNTTNIYSPICISELTDLQDVEVLDVVLTDTHSIALDKDGNIWLWGTNTSVLEGMLGETKKTPTKVDCSYFGNARIKQIAGSSSNGNYAVVVDENGKVWTWGKATQGQIGNAVASQTIQTPICISDEETEKLYGIEIQDISTSQAHIIALDKNNTLWTWGGNNYYGQTGIYDSNSSNYTTIPRTITNSYNEHLEYNVKFKEVYTGSATSYALDQEGKVWVWGSNDRVETGVYTNYNDILNPTILDIPGNPIIKKVSVRNTSAIMVSEDGRVFVCGYAYKGDGQNANYSGTSITEITNNFNLDSDVIIKDVYICGTGPTYVAIDSEGKVYTWGATTYLGRSSSNATSIICISDDDNEVLKGVKIVKLDVVNYNNVVAIDENGELYYWNSRTVTKALNVEAKFVDIVSSWLIDSEGKLWTVTNDNLSNLTCKSDDASNPLYKNYALDSEYKILEIYQYDNTNSPNGYAVVLKDSNGDLWKYEYGYSNSVYKFEDIMDNYDMIPKEIISLHGYLLVDKYGQIWVYRSISNTSGEAGNGTTLYINEPICLTNAFKNSTFGIKMKNVLSDSYVVSDKGDVYKYAQDNSAVTRVGTSLVEYLEGTIGIKVVQSSVDSRMGTDPKYLQGVAIDENGKLWDQDHRSVRCLSDIAGTQLWQKYQDDSNFRIEKVYYFEGTSSAVNVYGTKFAIDNYGKIWAWGDNSNGECGIEYEDGYDIDNDYTYDTTYQPYPICLNEYNDTLSLYGYSNIESIECNEQAFIVKDNSGKVWIWGYSSNGSLGDGNYSTHYRYAPLLVNNSLSNKAIKDISINKGDGSVILCTDGSVYIAGDSNMNSSYYNWKLLGKCEGATNVFAVSGRDVYFVTGENKVWGFGHNNDTDYYYGQCGTNNTTTTYIKVPTLISSEFTLKEVSYTYTSKAITAIDTNGKMWTWGSQNKADVTGPVCLNNTDTIITYLNTIGTSGSKGTNGYVVINDNAVISGREEQDLSNVVIDIYGELTKENILKLINVLKNSSVNTIYICEQGKLWEIIIDDYNCVTSYKCLNTELGGELLNKYIVDGSAYKAIDSDGNLYVWQNYTGLEDRICIEPVCTTTIPQIKEGVFKANNTVINVPEDNNLYGVKIKELVNDYFAIDENNDIWYFTSSGNAMNLSDKYQGDKNPLYGKEIIKVINSNYIIASDNRIYYIGGDFPACVMDAMSIECEYIDMDFNTAGYEYYIALDSNGKIWSCGVNSSGYLGTGTYNTNKKPVCLNDIEGTELNNAHLNNSNFKIEYLGFANNNTYYAIDNLGKLWAWGYNNSNAYYSIGNGTTGNILQPICLSNIEGTDLCTAYTNNSEFKIEEIITDKYYSTTSKYNSIKDNTGEIWTVDNNTRTFKRFKDIRATGDLEQAYLDNSEFKVAKLYNNGTLALGNDGTVYFNDSRTAKQYIKISGVTGVTDILDSYSYGSSTSGKSDVYIAYGTDGVYKVVNYERWNSSGNSLLEHNITGSKFATCNIVKTIKVENNTYIALDDEGKIWAFGENTNSKVGISGTDISKCLTETSSYALYNKQIKDIDAVYAINTTSNPTILVTDMDDNLYAWSGLANSNTPELYTKFDDIIMKVYGEVNNNNRIEFTKNSAIDITSYTDEFVGGIGKIEGVVGEYEIKAVDGKIYRVSTTGTISVVDEATPFVQQEIEPIEIEGANIVKQTKYKALDDNGNLYVWDAYTGLSTKFDGVICLTDEQYYIEPIYSNSNGWSIIKNQF